MQQLHRFVVRRFADVYNMDAEKRGLVRCPKRERRLTTLRTWEKALPFFGRKKRIKTDDVRVEIEGWQQFECSEEVVKYGRECGDIFSINFFNKPPDIGARLDDVAGVRNFYRNVLIANNMGLIECDCCTFSNMPSVYMLAKIPMEPRGFVFVASHTLPRKDHSVVLKYQAMESGITGIREAGVMAMLPTPEIDETTNRIVGWCEDPYDSSLEYSVMRNKADAKEYDEMFPDHPLSRARKFMDQLESRTHLSDKFRALPEFKN